MNRSARIRFRFAVVTGRPLLTLSLLALIGAWVTQATQRPFLTLDQQHLFFDALTMAVLGIGSLVDSLLHAKSL